MLILFDELGSSLLFKYVHLTLKDYNKFEFNISVTGAELIGIIRLDIIGYKTNISVYGKKMGEFSECKLVNFTLC